MKHLSLQQQRERQDIQLRFGRKMAQLRVKAGITQERLSFSIGVDRTYISYLERGQRNPSLYLLAKMAKVLRVRLIDLVNF